MLEFLIETEQEADVRWLAEVPALPGALAYGTTRDDAVRNATALGLLALSEKVKAGYPMGSPASLTVTFRGV